MHLSSSMSSDRAMERKAMLRRSASAHTIMSGAVSQPADTDEELKHPMRHHKEQCEQLHRQHSARTAWVPTVLTTRPPDLLTS